MTEFSGSCKFKIKRLIFGWDERDVDEEIAREKMKNADSNTVISDFPFSDDGTITAFN